MKSVTNRYQPPRVRNAVRNIQRLKISDNPRDTAPRAGFRQKPGAVKGGNPKS